MAENRAGEKRRGYILWIWRFIGGRWAVLLVSLGSVVQQLDEMSGTRRSVYIVYFLAPAVLVNSHLDQPSLRPQFVF